MQMIKSIFLRITGALAFLGLIFAFPQTALFHPKITQPLRDLLAQSIQIGNLSMTTLLLAAAGGLLLIAVILWIIMAISSSRRKDEPGKVSWQAPLQAPAAGAEVSTKPRSVDAIAPVPAPSGNILGALVIVFSDDPSLINLRITIDLPVIHLGRKADNDIIFVKDSPVSHHHAVIENRNGQMYLSEVVVHDDVTGQDKRPAYGTFVNGAQVQGPVMLKDGDEIMLGKRLRMRYEVALGARTEDERTLNHTESGLDDSTISTYSGETATSPNGEQSPSISRSVDDDTLVSKLGNKPKLPGQEDKTMPTRGKS